MKDGVEYTVRFGTTRHTLTEGGDSKAKKDDTKTGDETKRAETIRRVFVTSRFNEDLIPKPALEKVPDAKPADKKPGETKPDEKKPADTTSPPNSIEKTAPTKPPATGGPTIKAPDSKKPDGKKSADANRPELLLALSDDAQLPAATKGADKAAAKSGSAGTPAPAKPPAAGGAAAKAPGDAAKNPADAKKPDDAKKPNADAKTSADKNGPSDLKRADEEKARDAERQRIEADNKRKTDDYNATVKKGKERAKQLNDRFADWYYFITEDDYKKVHVGRAEIVKKKPAPEGGAATPSTPGLGPGLTDPFQKATQGK